MERVKLGDVAKLINGDRGKNYPSQSDITMDGDIPFVNAGHLSAGEIGFEEMNYISMDKYENLNSGKFQKGDILYCLRGSLGKKAIVRKEIRGAIASSLVIIRPNSKKISSEYLMFALDSQTIKEQLEKKNNGSSQPNLSASSVKEYQIELPGLSVQKEITKKLSKAKNVIDDRKKELQLLDMLIKARFVELFGNGYDGFCNTKKLGEFCKFQQGTQVPVEEQIEEQIEGYTRFLRIIDYTQAPQIPRYVSVKGRKIAEDSVVIVRYGATAGFVGHGYAGILANNLFEVVPDESILSKDFLYLALKYGTFEQEVHDKAFGAAMPALSFGMMNDIRVVTPNSTVQKGFVNFVNQVDKSKVAVQKALDETQTLFDSLMQKYFG